MIKLNKTSYVHVKIRQLCAYFEAITGLKLATNLSADFNEIFFMNQLSYIKIDYQNETLYVLSYRIGSAEEYIIDYLVTLCNWLELDKKISNFCNENVTIHETQEGVETRRTRQARTKKKLKNDLQSVKLNEKIISKQR